MFSWVSWSWFSVGERHSYLLLVLVLNSVVFGYTVSLPGGLLLKYIMVFGPNLTVFLSVCFFLLILRFSFRGFCSALSLYRFWGCFSVLYLFVLLLFGGRLGMLYLLLIDFYCFLFLISLIILIAMYASSSSLFLSLLVGLIGDLECLLSWRFSCLLSVLWRSCGGVVGRVWRLSCLSCWCLLSRLWLLGRDVGS